MDPRPRSDERVTAALRPAPLLRPAGRPADGVVALRAWREADLPALAAASRDPALTSMTSVPRDWSEAAGRAWLDRAARRPETSGGVTLAIAHESSDEAVGGVSLNEVSWQHRRAGVGYWVVPAARGAGVGSRGLRLLCEWAFARLPLERLEALVEPGNAASLAVARRAGFRREGLLRSYCVMDGAARDVVLLARLRRDPGPDEG